MEREAEGSAFGEGEPRVLQLEDLIEGLDHLLGSGTGEKDSVAE